MSALVVAPFAGSQFIFHPTGAAFNAGDEVFRCRGVERGERGRAPHAIRTISLNDFVHPLFAVQLSVAVAHMGLVCACVLCICTYVR